MHATRCRLTFSLFSLLIFGAISDYIYAQQCVSAAFTAAGKRLMDRRDFSGAVREFKTAYEEAVRATVDAPVLVTCLQNLGDAYFATGDYAQSEYAYNSALKILAKDFDSSREQASALYFGLAAIAEKHKKFEDAETLLRQAMAIAEKTSDGKMTPQLLRMLGNLAWVKHKLGQDHEAESLAQYALEYAMSAGHTYANSIPNQLDTLATIKLGQGKLKEAELYASRALAAANKHLHHEHPNKAAIHDTLGEVHFAQGNHDLAEKHYTSALTTFEKTFGLNHKFHLPTLSNLKDLYKKLEKMEEVAAFEKRIDEINSPGTKVKQESNEKPLP